MEMTIIWNYRLIALSVVIAIIGSYVALDFAIRMRSPAARHKALLFILGSLAMGLAIWTMHFLGMLAMHTNMSISYDQTLSALSILAATIGAGLAFSIMKRKHMGLIQLCTGSIAMGMAICSMHYIGMASMRMGAVIHYIPSLFVLSVFIAIFTSAAALWLSFQLKIDNPSTLFYQKIGSAILMGVAISSMHYTGMAAAQYVIVPGASYPMDSSTVGNLALSDLLIIASIIFGITLVILSSRSEVEFQTVKELNKQINKLALRYTSLVAHANEAIISINPKNKVTLWNSAAERLFGYSESDALGKDIADLIVPLKYQPRHYIEMINQFASRKKKSSTSQAIEMTAHRNNKEVFPIELSLFQSGIGDSMEYTSIIRDITERKKSEADIKSSEEMKRLMINSIKDYAIFLIDPNGIVTSWNTGAERINGYTSHEILGKHFSIFYLPEALQKNHPSYELEMAIKHGEYVEQGWRLRKNKSTFWANVTITPVYRKKRLIGFCKVVQDLTEQKKLKDQVEASFQELESFSYTVSHDLRAPLRSIDGFSKLVLEQFGDKLDEQGKHFLSRVREGTQQMGQLIDDILKLSHLSRVGLAMEKNVDLTAMAKSIIANLQQLDPAHKVEVDIEEGLLTYGDKRLLRIVLQNLFENAWKFTSHHATAHIAFKTTSRGGKIVYYVKDDGAGFDMAYAKKLFEPFQRLHQPQEFQGTGIGLATVNRIIKRHHGKIWAESVVEKGAVFYFTLEKMGD
jgi:PAS domain S-box-containing protein